MDEDFSSHFLPFEIKPLPKPKVVKKWYEKPRRKKRVNYTDAQVEVLVREFGENPLPSSEKLASISNDLEILPVT